MVKVVTHTVNDIHDFIYMYLYIHHNMVHMYIHTLYMYTQGVMMLIKYGHGFKMRRQGNVRVCVSVTFPSSLHTN